MISRRVFVGALAGGVLAAPTAAGTQQAGKVYRVGVLGTAPRERVAHLVKAVVDGLRDVGYLEGRNLSIEYRSADGKEQRLPALAAELVGMAPDAIIPLSTPAALAAKRATSTIPIVMVSPGEPVKSGLVESLARPGGNITGVTLEITPATSAKQLQLLKEVDPRIRRVAVVANPAYHQTAVRWDAVQQVARELDVSLLPVDVRGPDDLERAFAMIGRERSDGLLVLGDPALFAVRQRIGELAAKHRLPSVSPYREAADAGGLLAYGAKFIDAYRRVGVYVDKILKGARPGDLPVEQPPTFELVINLKTAKALGLTIPPSLLLRADGLIR